MRARTLLHTSVAAMSLLILAASSSTQDDARVTQEKPAIPKDVPVDPGTPKAWTLLVCSVQFERNGSRHDLLAGDPSSADRVLEVRELLNSSWDIVVRSDLLAMLEWLALEGHRTEFDEFGKRHAKASKAEREAEIAKSGDLDERRRMEFAANNWVRLGKTGMLGWDLTRYVALCRWGYACGFLTEEETWERLFPIAQKLQKAYRSWEDLGESYCTGYEYWGGNKVEETRQAFERLKTRDDSPWKATRWGLKLDPKAKLPVKKTAQKD